MDYELKDGRGVHIFSGVCMTIRRYKLDEFHGSCLWFDNEGKTRTCNYNEGNPNGIIITNLTNGLQLTTKWEDGDI